MGRHESKREDAICDNKTANHLSIGEVMHAHTFPLMYSLMTSELFPLFLILIQWQLFITFLPIFFIFSLNLLPFPMLPVTPFLLLLVYVFNVSMQAVSTK